MAPQACHCPLDPRALSVLCANRPVAVIDRAIARQAWPRRHGPQPLPQVLVVVHEGIHLDLEVALGRKLLLKLLDLLLRGMELPAHEGGTQRRSASHAEAQD